jgi:hypothetical protein
MKAPTKPRKVYGIRTLADIRDRCYLVDGHWIWKGAYSKQQQQCRIWAPDHTKGGKLASQPGPRAVWHAKTGKPIPEGHRVFRNCTELRCINPDHVVCLPTAENGRRIAASGRWKGVAARVVANRAINLRRSTVTDEALALIMSSDLTGREITERTGVSRTTISRLRSGKSVKAVGMFAGLGARP